eukprot:scaffold326_cov169-Ochromonas_danica.AAC.1
MVRFLRSTSSFALDSRRRASSSTSSSSLSTAMAMEMKLEGMNFPPVHFFSNDHYEVPLPPKHRFPMEKYRLVRQSLQHDYERESSLVTFHKSPLATFDELVTTHCPKYVSRVIEGKLTEKEVRKTGFPWSEEHVRRTLSSVGGTVAAMRSLFTLPNSLFAGHLAGGTHHAFYDYGEGFCVFSDIAVATNVALKEFPHDVKKVLIIDLDVHQGNGNAVLFEGHPEVCTFSLHCVENYFSTKQVSTLDIELPGGSGDEAYLAALGSWLPYLLNHHQPDLAFFQAGVDIHEEDKLGKLKVTREGIRRRNHMVFEELAKRGIKTVVTMGGGYPQDLSPSSSAFRQVVSCHADVYRECLESYRSYLAQRMREEEE